MPSVSTSGPALGYLPAEDLTAHGHVQQSHQPGGIRHRLRGHPSAVRSRLVAQLVLPAGLRHTIPLHGETRQDLIPGTPVSLYDS